ncbi:DUF952 domain-containing protein [Spelaeicoccus albus]|uniref:Uncharacterized protein (DUF952 family) n=1 Tax=Spelaeicoccus albus TaxID=1280376 RepID=A0A7Z0IIX6_9MICO|nr:DUF952 domain-containing protein [Spelaeicoccus albus]NYI68960.1 uncharacterized protein (DUF952 family) [Spelaeicoccus albus]
MRLLHLALADDFEAARPLGEYTVSTRGTSVDDAGFIHASTAGQLPKIASMLYSDVHSPLVVLVIDEDELAGAGIEVKWETPHGSDQLFPHIYGPLPTDNDTVVAVVPVEFSGRRFVMPDLSDYDVRP